MNDIEQLTGIPLSKGVYKDLGTEINFNDRVEMYSNSNCNSNSNEKGNKKKNTFQPEAGNVLAPAALPFSSTGASHPGVKKDQEIPGKPGRGFRKLSTEDLYTEINVQINNIRTEGKYDRVTVYVSLKEEMDSRYSIFFRGAATTCMTELRRGAKDDKAVLDVIETFRQDHPECLIGRLLYRAPRGVKMADMHRTSLRHAMIAIYCNDDELECELYLLGEWYTIPLNVQMTEKQQEVFYKTGIWRREIKQFTGDEELA